MSQYTNRQTNKVIKILDRRIVNGKMEYLVLKDVLSSIQSKWESIQKLDSSIHLINDFNKQMINQRIQNITKQQLFDSYEKSIQDLFLNSPKRNFLQTIEIINDFDNNYNISLNQLDHQRTSELVVSKVQNQDQSEGLVLNGYYHSYYQNKQTQYEEQIYSDRMLFFYDMKQMVIQKQKEQRMLLFAQNILDIYLSKLNKN